MNNKKKTDRNYKLMKGILGPIFRLVYHFKSYNKDVIPKEGPIILCGNHIHVYDQCLALLCTKRPVNYMAKKEYWEGKGKWFFDMVGCIPVNRQIKDEAAKEKAISILNSGGAIGIFPEGTRNKTDDLLLPFKFGAVSMAQKTNATIVPFAVSGDYKFTNKNLMVRFGDPFKVEDMSLEEANNKLYNSVKDLLLKNLKSLKKDIKK